MADDAHKEPNVPGTGAQGPAPTASAPRNLPGAGAPDAPVLGNANFALQSSVPKPPAPLPVTKAQGALPPKPMRSLSAAVSAAAGTDMMDLPERDAGNIDDMPIEGGDEAPKRVIRTFQSDMAKLSGQPPPTAEPSARPQGAPRAQEPAGPPPPPPPAPAFHPAARTPTVTEHAASPQEYSFLSKVMSEVENVLPKSAPPPPAWEAQAPPQAPSEPQRAPAPMPQVPAPKYEEPINLSEDAPAEREAILARLRAKVSAERPPAPEAPAAPPAYAPPPVETMPAWTPPPQPALRKPVPEEPERLHTYSSDFSERADAQNASAFSVLAAQSDARREAPPAALPHTPASRGLLYMLGGATLIIGGSLVVYFAYSYFSGTAPVAIVATTPPSVLTGDDSFTLTNSASLVSDLAEKAAESSSIGTVRIAYLAVSSSTPTGVVNETLPGGSLLLAMNLPAPDILLRNIAANSTVGVVHAGDDSRAFFVLSTASYERTFAGMLSWEPTMVQDLVALYPMLPEPTAVAITASTTVETATSTPPLYETPIKTTIPGFRDEVVANRDVRAYKDAWGRTVLLYGYRDQHTLIITRDEEAFTVLLARLAASGQ